MESGARGSGCGSCDQFSALAGSAQAGQGTRLSGVEALSPAARPLGPDQTAACAWRAFAPRVLEAGSGDRGAAGSGGGHGHGTLAAGSAPGLS